MAISDLFHKNAEENAQSQPQPQKVSSGPTTSADRNPLTNAARGFFAGTGFNSLNDWADQYNQAGTEAPTPVNVSQRSTKDSEPEPTPNETDNPTPSQQPEAQTGSQPKQSASDFDNSNIPVNENPYRGQHFKTNMKKIKEGD